MSCPAIGWFGSETADSIVEANAEATPDAPYDGLREMLRALTLLLLSVVIKLLSRHLL
jgi:hypothetical protein